MATKKGGNGSPAKGPQNMNPDQMKQMMKKCKQGDKKSCDMMNKKSGK